MTAPRIAVVLVVLGAIAGALVPANVPAARSHGLAVQAPGSQGSLSHLPWWDPRGWFGSGQGAPASHALAGTAAALRSHPRALREVKAPPARRVRELASKRTEYGRVYQLSDGRRQAVISAAPVNYRSPSGRWKPISTRVTRSGRAGFAYQNVTNTFRSFFGTSAGRLARFEVPGGGWLSIGMDGAHPARPRVAGDTVTYPDIAPGVSLSYRVTPTSLKESLTLASPAAASSFSYTIRTGGGLVPHRMRNGSVAFSRGSAGGPPVLVMPAPVMTSARMDASSPYGHVWSPKVSQQVSWDAAAKTLRVTVTPSASWLHRAGRAFPVVIDPTIEIAPTPSQAQNAMIESDTPTANYSSSWRLSVGTTSSAAVRALLSFPLGTIPSGTQIDSADLRLYWDQTFGPGSGTETIEAAQATSAWSASTVTWNTGPGVGTEGLNEIDVDDSDTAHTSASGAWPQQADSAAVNGEYAYNQDTVSGDTFTWVPQITESGNYWVSGHYVADPAAASNAPVTVDYNGGSANFTVNQQSGSGGVWDVLGQEPFAAGTAGKVVLGDGPASSSVRVEADEVRFRKWGEVTDNLASDNLWDTFSVRNIVQSWLDGSAANDGFVVKAKNESNMNVGGPRYEASQFAYNGETANYPQLVVTYGLPSVTLNPITTINATGADLSWTPYTDPTPNSDPSDDLAEYQVYRSVYQTFTPSASTLVAPVPAGTTSFDDTSAPPAPAGSTSGNAMYYMVAVKTAGGQIIPGATQLVRLPVAGHTTQIIDASGDTTLSSGQPATSEENIAGSPWLDVGDNSSYYGDTRVAVKFPSLGSAGIPAGSTITDAHLKLWGWYNDNTGGGSATYDAHALTQAFDPATATWDDASSGTAWTTPGGTYDPTVASSVTGLTNDPNRENWPVTSIAQSWLDGTTSQDGLLVKLSGESSSSPQQRELFLNSSAEEAALRPELVVTYLDTTPADTYYAPHTPHGSTSASSYTTPVTVTNTTTSTLNSSDWVLTYHWLTPDGTDVTTSSDQAQTALPSNLAPGAQATITATVDTPDTSGTGASRKGYQLLWDLYDKTTGTWLSSGTSTPNLIGTSTTAGTVGPLNQVTSVARSASDLLGLEQYYQYTGVNTGAGSALLNNDDTGNVVWNYNAFSNPSRGFRTFVRLDYNSMDTSDSAMGFGWSLQASTLMRLGTPLDFHPKPDPTTITLTDGDGTSHTFTWDSSTSTWTSPPGFHYYLQQLATCDPSGKTNNARAWLMTAPDRTQFYFDCQGYQSAVVDKNGNEADFTYTDRKSNNKPVKFLDYITDPSGRQTLTISYYAKGDSYDYIDSNGNVASGTSLTNPKIIDQVKSITGISGRQITFLYDTEGLMAQMTDGAGTPMAKTFKFGYDMTQGNKNVKLVSVTDPRGHTTNLAYYTAPQDPTFKWSLQKITDRLTHATSFAYTVPSGGGIQAQVTDPKTNVTTYLMDSSGRPVQVTNAKSQVTKLAWDADNNVTSLTEDNGATTTWTYDDTTGYPTSMKDAQANHDGTAGYTYSYQTALSGHTADLTSLLTPQQRLWTFGYDASGNLTSVTKPLGNVSGAAAGSYTTSYTYDSAGDLLTAKDPNGNTTKYADYDPTGYPQQITDAREHTTKYAYSSTGNVTSVTDPLGRITTQAYDIFGRPGKKVVPKTSTTSITTAAPVYDGNDNVTTSYAPSASGTGAATTYTYNAGDELVTRVTPSDTSTSAAPETTYTYDADGNLASVTRPDGNASGAAAGSYTTTYGYDAINELTSVTDALSGVTKYGYNDVGDRTSVTDPDNNQTQYAYNLNHQLIQVTDAADHTTKTGYDLDGLVTSRTDQNSNTTEYTLDADGQVTQAQVPAQVPGAPVSYDTIQYVYDQDGNRTKVITPRGVASGISGAYTWQTKYNADNQVSAQLSAYNPNDPAYNTPAETDYTYNNDGRLASVSAPASNGSSSVRNVTSYSYFDNGWVQSSTSPAGITTSYDYNPRGEQSARTITSAGGAMSRTMTWGYYPDGKLSTLTDDGVPTGLYAEMADNSDFSNTTSTGTWATSTAGSGYEGYNYATHAAGTGTDTFTWHLNIPEDGTYAVYVKYPAVSGAATNASYQVSYSGGTTTASVDQTQNAGTWVKLGSWAFTKAGTSQQVTLSENSAGTVVADAVKVVRDNSGEANTATHTFSYTYDLDGNQTGIADTSPGAAITSYAMGYDQLDRLTTVKENNSSGSTVHTTSYGYDAASNLTSRTHDVDSSTYTYTSLNQLAKETDNGYSTKITSFTYTPTGQTATEAKPNGNTVTNTYYANGLLDTRTEKTSGGTLVSSHAYTYDPNGNQAQDTEKLMSADNNAAYLSHTLTYAYDPMDRIATVSTDGTVTESYAHDPSGNVTSQTVGGTTTSYTYDQNRLLTATTGGATADYNYDPLGRLDTVTSGGTILESNTYDGFDNITARSQYDPSAGTTSTTSYTYDALNRMASQTTSAGTTSYAYLGLSSQLISESGPGSQSKAYTYTPGGLRIAQTTVLLARGSSTDAYYTYNSHHDVEAVTGGSGTTTATYGYTAYGSPVTSMTTGADKNNTTPGSATTPYNSYRFNAMRWDASTGQYDMGFRTYDPGLNQFLTRDMYDGALADMHLTADPFTGSPYAFGQGNPVSNIELNGHMPCAATSAGEVCGSIQYLEHHSTTSSGSSGSGGGSGPSVVQVSPHVSALSSNPNLGKLRAAWNWAVSKYGQPHSAEAEFSDWWRACGISPYHSACAGQFGANFSGLNLNYSLEGAFHAGIKLVVGSGGKISGYLMPLLVASTGSRILGKNLIENGYVRLARHEAHHIVAENDPRARPAQDVLDRLGIDINDADNGVFLPGTADVPNPGGAVIHRGATRTDEYMEYVNTQLADAQTEAQAREILQFIRTDLLAGNMPWLPGEDGGAGPVPGE